MYPKALSQLSWSLASSRTQDRVLITELASAIGSHASSFQVRDLAMAMWSLAKLSADDSSAWRELQFQASKKLNECSHQDVSNLSWAFAKPQQGHPRNYQSFMGLCNSNCASWASGNTPRDWEERSVRVYCKGHFNPCLVLRNVPAELHSAYSETDSSGDRSNSTPEDARVECPGSGKSLLGLCLNRDLLCSICTCTGGAGADTSRHISFARSIQHLLGFCGHSASGCSRFDGTFNKVARPPPTSTAEGLATCRDRGLVSCRPSIAHEEVKACASVWAFNAAALADAQLASCVKSRVLSIGQALDESSGLHPLLRLKEKQLESADVSGPEVILELADRLVLRKPSGWDIQRSGQDSNLVDVKAVPTVADFLSSRHAAKTAPIFCDRGHQSGMIHRLDVPNSGLLLVAKSYRAYYDLMFQMNTGMVRRDYVVLCHGWIPRSCQEIAAPLHWGQNIAPSMIRQHGKPARTFLKVLSHLIRQPEGDCYSLVEVSIETGRRHQIRSHLSFMGHALVGDAKYSSAATFQVDHILCNRNFLHRVRLSFFDQDGRPVEAADTLPTDLSFALSALEAKDDESEHWKLLWSR